MSGFGREIDYSSPFSDFAAGNDATTVPYVESGEGSTAQVRSVAAVLTDYKTSKVSRVADITALRALDVTGLPDGFEIAVGSALYEWRPLEMRADDGARFIMPNSRTANLSRNPGSAGASVGNVAVAGVSTGIQILPDGWALSASGGLTVSVVSAQVVDGIEAVTVRFQGTASATACGINFQGTTEITAAPSQAWAAGVYARLDAAPNAPLSHRQNLQPRNAAGGSIGGTVVQATFTPGATLARTTVQSAAISSDVTIARINSQYVATLTNGATYDWTITLGGASIQQQATVSAIGDLQGRWVALTAAGLFDPVYSRTFINATALNARATRLSMQDGSGTASAPTKSPLVTIAKVSDLPYTMPDGERIFDSVAQFNYEKTAGDTFAAVVNAFAFHRGGEGQIIGLNGRVVANHPEAEVFGEWTYALVLPGGCEDAIGGEDNIVNQGADPGWRGNTPGFGTNNVVGRIITTADSSAFPCTKALYIAAQIQGGNYLPGFWTGIHFNTRSIVPTDASGNGEAISINGGEALANAYKGVRFFGHIITGVETIGATLARGAMELGSAQYIAWGGDAANGGLFRLASSSNGTLTWRVTASEIRLQVNGTGNDAVLIWVNGSLKQITQGASDSGGTGFRVLRVPN